MAPRSLSKFRLFGATLLAAGLVVSGCGALGKLSSTSAATRAASATQADAVVSGNFTLLTLPDDGLAPMLTAMRTARKSIKVKIYMLTDHDETAELVQALIDRAQQGLDVEVVLEVRPYLPPEQATNCLPNNQSPNQPAITRLLAGGVRVRYASPRFKFTHEKSMVIDEQTAYVMTCNFTNAAFTSNREYVIIDRDPVDVAELLRCFAADWDSTPFVPGAGPLVLSPEDSRLRILNLIDSATKTLTIQVEYLTDAEVTAHIAARVQAGVDVKIMLAFIAPSGCDGDGDTNAQEHDALTAAGVTQFEFAQTLKMHAKCIVADGARAFVGSENLTTTSLDKNREVGILLSDPLLLAKLIATQNQDWLADVKAPTGGSL